VTFCRCLSQEPAAARRGGSIACTMLHWCPNTRSQIKDAYEYSGTYIGLTS
jgi:hypothetical protein